MYLNTAMSKMLRIATCQHFERWANLHRHIEKFGFARDILYHQRRTDQAIFEEVGIARDTSHQQRRALEQYRHRHVQELSFASGHTTLPTSSAQAI